MRLCGQTICAYRVKDEADTFLFSAGFVPIEQAGLLARGSSFPVRLPSLWIRPPSQWLFEPKLPSYSGGTAPASHRTSLLSSSLLRRKAPVQTIC